MVRHLEEMHAAEHLDEAGAIERSLLNGEVQLLDPMLIGRDMPNHPLKPAADHSFTAPN
jgi:hypothetical protein